MKRFEKMRLEKRLMLSMTLVGSLPALLTLIVSYYMSSSSLKKEALAELEISRDIKKEQVEDYFGGIEKQVKSRAESTMTVQAFKQFKAVFDSYEDEANLSDVSTDKFRTKVGSYYKNDFSDEYESQNGSNTDVSSMYSTLPREALVLQSAYIMDNSFPLGNKERMDRADHDAAYNQIHESFHPLFRSFLEEFGYYDVFLVDAESGNIIYSVFKELDFATSLKDGPYADSNFDEVFRETIKKRSGDVVFADFEEYRPSYDAPASFIGAPVMDGDECLGALIFQMPIDRLNQLVASGTRSHNSGEVYLVGKDGRMRSDSRFDIENKTVVSSFRSGDKGVVSTDAFLSAIGGDAGVLQGENYVGGSVLTAYTSVDLPGGIKWVLLSELGKKEATAAATTLALTLAGVGAIGVLCLAGLAWGFGVSVSRPIKGISQSLRSGAARNFESSANVSEKSRKLADSASNQAASIEETSASLEEMSSMTRRNADNAGAAKRLAGETRDSAEEGGGSLDTMRRALQEIDVAGSEMKTSLTALQDSGKKVSNIVKAIDEIAFQTNILALNAAVEAARAGEAGMGFAVVADEVRNLAQRSASAAQETASIVEESITKSKESVDASENVSTRLADVMESSEAEGAILESIIGKAREVDGVVAQIAIACEEQSQGVCQISSAVNDMDQATQTNAAAAESCSNQAETLRGESEALLGDITKLENLIGGTRKESGNMATEVAKETSVSTKGYVALGQAMSASDVPERIVGFEGADDDDAFLRTTFREGRN